MAKTNVIEVEIELVAVTCTCGVVFGMPTNMVRSLRTSHQTYYCPRGDQQYFPGQSEEEKLRAELASANGNAKFYRERTEKLSRSLSAQRGVKTRLLNRIKDGICPFCNRRFDALGIHVRAEHGDEVAAEVAQE